jgi:hypothetical protein
VKRHDLGPASAAGLLERADTPANGDIPASADAKTTLRVTPAAVRKIRSRLGIVAAGDDRKSSNWQALTHREFRQYFIGSVGSNLGTWLQNTAQVVLAYQLTRSVFWVGLVTCAQFSSPLFLGPWAGVLAHRLGTWRTLIVTQCASMLIALALMVLQFTHALNIGWLFAGALSIGFAFTFALPALSVTVAALVPPTETKKALAMDSVSYNLGRALAPVAGVLILTTIGAGWAFALNAASFAFFTVVLLRLRPRETVTEASRSKIMNSFRLAWQDPRIMIMLLMVASVTIAADPILVLGPALAGSFGSSADWSGVFITALGAGNVIGSLRRTRQAASIRRAAAALCILSISMIAFVSAPWIQLSVVAAFAAGAACLVAGAAIRALLLQHAGPGRQAAVMAAWALAWAGSKPIASFADGTFAGIIGVRPTGILLALPALAPALVLVLCPAFGRRLAGHLAFDLAS